MAENLKRQDGLPPAMTRLVKELSRLPGIGEKTASRLAFNLLNRPRDQVIALAESLLEMKERVGLCSGCFGLSDHPRCQICDDEAREREVICVVEGPADLMAIERARSFGGVYHVLQRRARAARRHRPRRHQDEGIDCAREPARRRARSDNRHQRDRRRRSDRALYRAAC